MKLKKQIRLLGSDLDGTLLNEIFELTPGVISAVKEAHNSNLPLVVITGRDHLSALPFLNQLGVENIFVGSGGAQIWVDGQPVVQSYFTPEQTQFILDLGKEFNVGMFIDQKNQAWNYGSRYYVDLFMHVSDSLECKDPITFLNLLPGKITLCQEHSRLQQIRRRLTAIFPTLTLSFSFPQALDINPSGGNKGEGLAHLANMLGLCKDEIAVVGDSENDMSMFLFAGLSIAMGNATDELRSKADIIAPPNSADGIVWVLRELMKANKENFTNSN